MAKNRKPQDTRQSVDIRKQMKTVKTGVQNGVFVFTGPLTVSEFANKLNKQATEIIKYFFMKGKMYSLNKLLTEDEMGEICLEFNLDFEKKLQLDETNIIDNLIVEDKEADKVKRAPVVTIMGHVDHGKTTLLDYIRKSHVTKGEFGGITQHIGAYQINKNGNAITFIDTPGHEAFTEMRARGASITDVVVLVVAADDGIKPQTEEAIDHAKAAKVPIIVFVNKMDKPNAKADKAMSELSEKGLTAEEWGGDTICVKGSALKGDGVDELLDSIITLTDIMELKANPNRDGMGACIEANMDKGLGPVATLLVQNGTIQKGDFIVLGEVYGRVRAIFNDLGKELKSALPGQPVKITGLQEVPSAGAKWLVIKDEALAKEVANKVKEKKVNLFRASMAKAEDANDTSKKLNLVIKCDVQGSLEAIKGMLEKVNIEGAKIDIVRAAIGAISESDIQLAKASKAIIIGFNVRPNKDIKDLATEQQIKFYFYNIIYKLKEDVVKMLYGTLDPISVDEDLGEAEVKQTWKHSAVGTIAGVAVTSGKILRNAMARVIRDGKEIYHNEIASLRHGKEVVNEITSGHECGIVIKNFNDIKVGDIIQIYKTVDKTAEEIANNK